MENFALFTMTSLIFFYRAYFLRYSYLSEVKKILQGTWSPPLQSPPQAPPSTKKSGMSDFVLPKASS